MAAQSKDRHKEKSTKCTLEMISNDVLWIAVWLYMLNENLKQSDVIWNIRLFVCLCIV